MRTLKAELLIFIGFIFIFTGTIVLEKPFIIRTYEQAASFGFLCDVAMYRYEDCTPTHTDKGLCAPETYGSSELQKARIYNMSITDMQKRQGLFECCIFKFSSYSVTVLYHNADSIWYNQQRFFTSPYALQRVCL